jgi:hypothetical protein
MIGYLLAVLSVFGVIFWIQAPPLIKSSQWRELAAFYIFLGLDLAISIPLVLGIRLPSPDDYLFDLFRPVVEWMLR